MGTRHWPEDAEEEYGLLLARNNVLAAKIAELEDENKRLNNAEVGYSHTIDRLSNTNKELLTKLDAIKKLPRYNVWQGHTKDPRGHWMDAYLILEILQEQVHE